MLGFMGGNMGEGTLEQALRALVDAMVDNDGALFSRLMGRVVSTGDRQFLPGCNPPGAEPQPVLHQRNRALHLCRRHGVTFRRCLVSPQNGGHLDQGGSPTPSEEPAWV